MGFQQKNKSRIIAGLKLTAVLLGVFLIANFIGGRPISTRIDNSGMRKSAATKQLRPIKYHAHRHVCAKPSGHSVSCTADISLNSSGQPLTGTAVVAGGYGPVQFHTAYNLPCTPGGSIAAVCSAPSSFGPETVAIVDAGNFSSGVSGLETSLADYNTQYGLAPCSVANGCLSVLNQSGASSPLPGDAGWSDEIALDVETVHDICQTCKIVLVEANGAVDSDMATAENTAASLNPVSISNSWGVSGDDTTYDSAFNHPGIAIVASTGDNGTVSNGAAWPADNPNVVAVAGTSLQLNTDNTWAGETVWSGSGGGCSVTYSAPSWQTAESDWANAGCGIFRSFGDVAADADPNTGAAINENGTWYQLGGTSLAAPIIASIYALNGGMPSSTIASSTPYGSTNSTKFHDITSGNDCTSTNTTHCTAQIGFDTPTGIGSPNGVGGFMSLPATPSLNAITAGSTQINLSWTASSSPHGTISGYYLYRNNVKIATLTATTFSDSGLTPNTTYDYYVIAYDSGGNDSVPSNIASSFSAYPADINEDGHIDLLDLSILASKYGQCGPNIGRADINGDGCVNLLDLSILASKYGSE